MDDDPLTPRELRTIVRGIVQEEARQLVNGLRDLMQQHIQSSDPHTAAIRGPERNEFLRRVNKLWDERNLVRGMIIAAVFAIPFITKLLDLVIHR